MPLLKCKIIGCDQLFNNKDDYYNHNRMHIMKGNYQCTYPKCIKMYKSSKLLRQHIIIKHKAKKFYCKDCDQSFSKYNLMLDHSHTHETEHSDNLKPFKIEKVSIEDKILFKNDFIKEKEVNQKDLSDVFTPQVLQSLNFLSQEITNINIRKIYFLT